MAVGIVLAGAAMLAIAVLLPQDAPTGGSLWADGTGWLWLVVAALAAQLTLRARRRGSWSWSGLALGALALLAAIGMARHDAYGSVEAGLMVLALGGLVMVAGWALGFREVRPTVAGLGPWSELPRVVREAKQPSAELAGGPTPGAAPPDAASLGAASLGAASLGRLRVRSPVVWSLAVYAVISLVFFGWPVRGELGSTLIASNTIDPSIYTWFYEWWPWSLVHGHNPFLTDYILVPQGYNLSWVTAVPGPSYLAAPVTFLFGPVVTYNALALAAPALSAWTAFLLCRHVTRASVPSLVAGYLFGFSPYMLRMLQGAPHLYFVALIPLFVLLVLWRLEGRIGDRVLFLGVAVGLAVQFFTSNDVLVTFTIFAAVTLALAFALFVEWRPLLLRTAGVIVAGYAGAAVLATPALFHMLFHGHTTPEQNTPLYANDLVSWVVPDSSLLVADTHEINGTPPQYGGLAYFGIPLLMLIGFHLWRNRNGRTARLLALCFAIPALCGLGHRLTVDGDVTRLGLPWSVVDRLPGIELLVPQRFALYAFLAAALILALVLAREPRVPAWGLGLLAVVAIVPWVGSAYWKAPVYTPAFFTTGEYRSHLTSKDRVLPIPIIGDSMRWQAEEDFPFKLVGGGVGAFPKGYTSYPAFGMLISGEAGPDYAAEMRRFVRAKGTTAVVAEKAAISPGRAKLLASLGVKPVDVGGVLLYRLRPPGGG
ncbi:MAG: hypothetical protein QOE60_31 [Thermoleophilaceae bacterium]|nr:hypothetical protein [Thermoleophilaceae bacterium]